MFYSYSKSTRKAKRNSNTFTPCSKASKCQWSLRDLFKWKWLESWRRDARQKRTGCQEASVFTDLLSAFDICWTIFQETLEANCLICFLPFCYYPKKGKKIFWPFILAQMQIESSLLTVIKSSGAYRRILLIWESINSGGQARPKICSWQMEMPAQLEHISLTSPLCKSQIRPWPEPEAGTFDPQP